MYRGLFNSSVLLYSADVFMIVCFQWLPCLAVKLTTEQEWFFFSYPIFIAFLLIHSVAAACKLVGEHAGRVKGMLTALCSSGAVLGTLEKRVIAHYFRVSSLPSFPISTLLPGTLSRSSFLRDPTRIFLFFQCPKGIVGAFRSSSEAWVSCEKFC